MKMKGLPRAPATATPKVDSAIGKSSLMPSMPKTPAMSMSLKLSTDNAYYHGSRSKLKTLRKDTWVTPYLEDAISFGVPWDSNDLLDRGSDPGGRPSLQLKFKKGREPKDSPIYVYKVNGNVKPALTNTGKSYAWNKQLIKETPVTLVKTLPSWKAKLLHKGASSTVSLVTQGTGTVRGEPADEEWRRKSVIDRAFKQNEAIGDTSSMPEPNRVVSP